jgi:hypothetical protein
MMQEICKKAGATGISSSTVSEANEPAKESNGVYQRYKNRFDRSIHYSGDMTEC